MGSELIELPRSLVRLLSVGVDALGGGGAVMVVSEQAEVSPAEAAKLLGVSRQYVDRLVATDVLPVRRLPGSRDRRIRVQAVLEHRDGKDRKRAGIDHIVQTADDAGLPY